MASYAFIIPVLPGRERADRQFGAELAGSRRSEYEASRARLGITREQAWQQETPQGTVTIVYLEAEDIEGALDGIAASRDPFDSWWREQVSANHVGGAARHVPDPANEQIIDFRGE